MKHALLIVALAIALLAQPAIRVTITATPHREVLRTASQTYTLAAAPAAGIPPLVWLNGLLMLEGEDYTLDGQTLTFTRQTIEDPAIIQVVYWS